MIDYIDRTVDRVVARVDSAYRGARVVVSGGAGFIGRYLVCALKRLGAEKVIVLDNLSTSGPDGERFVSSAVHDPVIEFLHWNVAREWPGFLQADRVSHVIHLAAMTSPALYKAYPLETVDAAVGGTRYMLELARVEGARMLAFSTSEIYGDPPPEAVPTREDYRGNVDPLGDRAAYDESKRLSETLCKIYHTQFDVSVVIVRPFNNYGEGMWKRDFRCVPNFAARLKAGEPLQVFAPGTQTRTFCHIEDGVVGFLQALANGRAGEAYNIGAEGPEITILELAERMGEIAKRKPLIEVVPHPDSYPSDEPSRRRPDITKARRELGFEPQVSLEDGLARFLRWSEATYGTIRARAAR